MWKSSQTTGGYKKPKSVADIAYTAGLIDGEGSVSLALHHAATTADGSRPRNSPTLILQLSVTDEAVIKWLCKTWGCGNIYFHKPRKKHHLPAWRWQTNGARAALILEACLPFMQIKKKQAKLAVAYRKNIGPASVKIGADAMKARLLMREEMLMLNRSGNRVRAATAGLGL